jgi:tellurite resistance protein TehA-like permease
MLGAIQVLPTWEHFTSSSRAAPSYEFLTHFSMHPMNLLSALSPWLFHHHIYTEQWYDPVEQAFYFGPVVPIAALWVALRWQRLGPWRPLLLGPFALAAVALILVLGKYTPAYRYFITLPLAGLVRVPARYSIALYFAGAVTAAVAFADLLRGDPAIRRRSAWIWLLPALSWLVVGTAVALRGPSWSWITDQPNPPRWIALGPLAFTAAAALWTAAVRLATVPRCSASSRSRTERAMPRRRGGSIRRKRSPSTARASRCRLRRLRSASLRRGTSTSGGRRATACSTGARRA